MSKKQILNELTNILAVALRHKIGSMVNKNEIYALKYSKDSEILFKEAEKIKGESNWDYYDIIQIKEELKRKLKNELDKKDFLINEKYDLMDSEIDSALISLGLV
jgi:transcription initiation factor IIF auxiliary subunit